MWVSRLWLADHALLPLALPSIRSACTLAADGYAQEGLFYPENAASWDAPYRQYSKNPIYNARYALFLQLCLCTDCLVPPAMML